MASGPRAVKAGAAPAVFSAVLARLEGDVAAYFQTGPLRLVPCRIEERPFSHLMLVEVWRADQQTSPISRLFVKVFKAKPDSRNPDRMRERVSRDFDTNRRVHAWMSAHGDLGAVPPVACYPEHLAIITEEVSGPTLLDYLTARVSGFRMARRPDEAGVTMATVGRWLRTFQGIDWSGTFVTVDALKQYIDHRLQRLVGEGPSVLTVANRLRVLNHIEALGARIQTQELAEVAVHSDMSLGNLIVSGSRIVVLDFAMAKRGSSLHDLTRLFVQLDLLRVKPHMRTSVVRHLQTAMIGGFDPSLTPESPLFRLLVLLHRVNHLTSMSVKRAPFLEGLYNAIVRRQHRHWLARELDSPITGPHLS